MNINVRHIDTGTLRNGDLDFEDANGHIVLTLRCSHENAHVENPCCSVLEGAHCGCRGVYSVVCPDCDHIQDLSDEDTERMLYENSDSDLW